MAQVMITAADDASVHDGNYSPGRGASAPPLNAPMVPPNPEDSVPTTVENDMQKPIITIDMAA
jgi:hypothetical protein